MADDEGQNKPVDEDGFGDYDGNEPNDGNDNIDTADIAGTTAVPQPQPPPIAEGENNFVEDYPEDDEPLPDVTVNLIINDQPDGVTGDIATAYITDEFGNVITTTPTWREGVDGYIATISQGIQDELTGNQTTVGGKGFFGKSSVEKGRERENDYEREKISSMCI